MIAALETVRLASSAANRCGRRVVLVQGMFDMLHVGHVRHLKEAKTFGEVLVVSLASDELVRSVKGPARPVVPQEQRAEILCALRVVDLVIVQTPDNEEAILRAVSPCIDVRGAEYTPETTPERALVESLGGSLKFTTSPRVTSSTELAAALRQDGQ